MGRAQRKSTVHELCTAHSACRRKKKGGHTNPNVRTIIIIIIYEKSQMYHPCGAHFARPIIEKIADVPSMWGSLGSPQILVALSVT